MNKVILAGRMVRDAELRFNKNGNAYGYFTVATEEWDSYKKEKVVDFVDVVVFGKMAENVAEHMKKGAVVEVEARIKSNKYEKDGKMVYSKDVVASEVRRLSKPNNS